MNSVFDKVVVVFVIFSCFGLAFGFSLGYLFQGRMIEAHCNSLLESVQQNINTENFNTINLSMVPNNVEKSSKFVENVWTSESYNKSSSVYCVSGECFSLAWENVPKSLKKI